MKKNLRKALAKLQATAKPKHVSSQKKEKDTAKSAIKAKNLSAGKQPRTVRFPYQRHEKILLVGEGNFSFTLALAKRLSSEICKENESNEEFFDDEELLLMEEADRDATPTAPRLSLTATTLDSQDITFTKYPDASSICNELQTNHDIQPYFNIDATRLATYPRIRSRAPFDRILFQFPHVGLGIQDQDRNIRANQQLILDFFQSAKDWLHPTRGQIHVTLKEGMPYTAWNIRALAKGVGLKCVASWSFQPDWFPGYAHRRTLGYQEGLSKAMNEEIERGGEGEQSKGSRTFCFALETFQSESVGRKKRARQDEDSD